MLDVRKAPGSGPVRAPEAATPSQALETDAGASDAVLCRACGARLSEVRAKIAVDGAHAHSFINPEGMIFRVGCFSVAPGARPVGEESDHWTWFPGFLWRAAICLRCGVHVGWCYRAASAGFVGLILDRVVERGEPPAAS